MVLMEDKIFVYGTLQKKYANAIDIIGDNELRFLGNGKIQGELYDLGDYPGVIEKLGTYVYGEVYQLADPGIVLSKLDEYEEFDSKNPNSLFVRRITNVIMEDGSIILAITYFYNKRTKKAKEDYKWQME